MTEKKELLKVGKYDLRFNKVLGIEIAELEIYRSKGLPTHLIKHNHVNCLKYIDFIPDMIAQPDYIGINPNETGVSIELVKSYKDNILMGIKLDTDGEYLYVSTLYDIQESKLQRRLHSGRMKEVSFDNNVKK